MSQPIAAAPPSNKLEVLLFAADPRSASGQSGRLLLDEEVRAIREKIRAAKFRDRVKLSDRGAVRTSDLLETLREIRPQVVHFSGHGERDGLAVVGDDGKEHFVPARGLASLFRQRGASVRVVVLNACYSLPLAEALVEQVGCAIGTPNPISESAALTFGSTFYYALASGDSVQDAFNDAVAALDLKDVDPAEYPQIRYRDDVDPSRLFLIPLEDEPGEPLSPLPLLPRSLPPESPAPATGKEWVFPLIVWMFSLGGLLWLVHSDLKALLLSAVPLAVTFGLLYVARASRGQVPMRVRAAAIAFAAFWVVVASLIVNSALETAKRRYAIGDYANAFIRFKELAEGGDSEAKGYLGILYMSPRSPERSDSLGIYWLNEAAQDGDPLGMYVLGIAYETGAGVPPNPREALRWYQGAERKHTAEAMNKIGELYRRGGPGITQSDDSALVWYGKAAHAGSVDGMSNLALMNELGLAGTRNLEEALRWHRRAADGGSTRAMVDVGWVHERGIGVRANPDSAAYWYRRAAEAGNEFGMNNLGVLYATGRGVPRRDCAMARAWIQEAADRHLPGAQENLARLDACVP